MFFLWTKSRQWYPLLDVVLQSYACQRYLYINGKISLLQHRVNSGQFVFRWFLFVSICLLKSNFDDQMTLKCHLIIGQLKMRQKWAQETLHWNFQWCCCFNVLCQIISLAIFREIPLAIYRDNVNLNWPTLQFKKNYLLNLWHKGTCHCLMCNVMVLIFMKATVLGTCYIFQQNINSQYKSLWPVKNSTYWHLMCKIPFIFLWDI